jgi:hypothetical protein
MNEQSPFFTRRKKQLPGGLNVLTILTFIGCGIGLLGSLWQFINAKKGLTQMEEMINSGKADDMPGFMKNMFSEDALQMAQKQYDNRYAMLILGLVGIVLCFYGALQMRKLLKQGYAVYVIGQLLPLVGAIIFLGFGMFKGMGVLAAIFPVLFIILYSTQLKHLK